MLLNFIYVQPSSPSLECNQFSLYTVQRMTLILECQHANFEAIRDLLQIVVHQHPYAFANA